MCGSGGEIPHLAKRGPVGLFYFLKKMAQSSAPLRRTKMEKPPLGLMPRKVAERLRFQDVCGAITRYYMANKKIPIEWIVEYNDLLDKVGDHVYGTCVPEKK